MQPANMTPTELYEAIKWWRDGGNFNLELLLRILEAKNK